jgi:hypothetical protein
VQLIGGMILHEGQIAEMRTGEGKTLVAVLPSYLNALEGGRRRLHPPCDPRPLALPSPALPAVANLPSCLQNQMCHRQGCSRGDSQ